jgi:hypothetical protein
LAIGIDAPLHYKANVEAYRQSSLLIKPCKENLSEKLRELTEQKRNTFNESLLAFDQKVNAYHNGTLSMGPYIDHLVKYTKAPSEIQAFLDA